MTGKKFRKEVKDWLRENFTDEMRDGAEGSDERKEWFRRLSTKGWGAPHWPKEYGGGGLAVQDHSTHCPHVHGAVVTARQAWVQLGSFGGWFQLEPAGNETCRQGNAGQGT